MGEIIAIIVTAIILGSAGFYIWQAKKKGNVKCIGCPDAKNCEGNCAKCQSSQRSKGFTKNKK